MYIYLNNQFILLKLYLKKWGMENCINISGTNSHITIVSDGIQTLSYEVTKSNSNH